MDDQSEVRLLAHLFWESEGCPLGREARHRALATKLAEAAALAPDRAFSVAQRARVGSLTGARSPRH